MRRLRKELWHGKARPRTSCKGLAGTARRVAGRLVMAPHGRLGRHGLASLGLACPGRARPATLCAARHGLSRSGMAGSAGHVPAQQGQARRGLERQARIGKSRRRWAVHGWQCRQGDVRQRKASRGATRPAMLGLSGICKALQATQARLGVAGLCVPRHGEAGNGLANSHGVV